MSTYYTVMGYMSSLYSSTHELEINKDIEYKCNNNI